MFKKIILSLSAFAMGIAAGTVSPVDAQSAFSAVKKRVGADGYRFDGATFEKNYTEIHMVYYDSPRDLRKTYRDMIKDYPGSKVKHGEIDGIFGFAEIVPDGSSDRCVVHIVHPERRYKPEALGHEVTHCLFGQFHN